MATDRRARAADPSTPVEELEELFTEFPVEVSANPNATPEQLKKAFWMSQNRATTTTIADALASNPALPLLLLLDPHFLLAGWTLRRGEPATQSIFEAWERRYPEMRNDRNARTDAAIHAAVVDALAPWPTLARSMQAKLDADHLRMDELYNFLQKTVRQHVARKAPQHPHRFAVEAATYLVLLGVVQRRLKTHEESFRSPTSRGGWNVLQVDLVPDSVLTLAGPHSLYQAPTS